MTKAFRWSPQQLAEYEAKVGRKLLNTVVEVDGKLEPGPTVKPAELAVTKPSKMRNKKVEWNGMVFDSGHELERYRLLLDWQTMGAIRDLHRQVTFVLAPAVQLEGNKRKTPALRYTADFVYVEEGRLVVEDAKGMKTRPYLQKKHLMKTIHGIDILET